MSRFIVCGKYGNGMVRVMDTSDNTVEPVTLEQVKLLHAMGYSISFNKEADYIYSLFYDYRKAADTLESISSIKGLGLCDYDNMYFDGVIVYVVYEVMNSVDDKVILLSIHKDGHTFKMYENTGIRELMGCDYSGHIFVGGHGDYAGVCFYKDNIERIMLFDMECNYIKTICPDLEGG